VAAAAYKRRMTPTSIVTVARTLGAGGERVAEAVAERLGFRFVDEEIIAIAAEREKVAPEVIADVERRKSFLARMLEAFSAGPTIEASALGGMMVDPSLYFPSGGGAVERVSMGLAEHYRELIRQAILATAQQGDVVIHAHAAGMTLAGSEGLLRVLVTAPVEVRVRRLVESSGVDAAEAEKTIRNSDRDRRDYFKRFHQRSDEAPTDYDLVLNTENLSLDRAVALVVAAAAS